MEEILKERVHVVLTEGQLQDIYSTHVDVTICTGSIVARG
jgi:hypothetical protein